MRNEETDLSSHLLKKCIIQPNENVSPPMPLLPTRRNVRHRPLIDLLHPLSRHFDFPLRSTRQGNGFKSIFFQSRIIEPDVVVQRRMREFLFVLESSFSENGRFDRGAGTELFFEIRVRGVELR